MPVKVTQPKSAPKPEAANATLDSATLKQIQKLSVPLAKKAAAMKSHGEALEKSTFQLYADFRDVVRENFADNAKAARQLAVNVLASVYDIPITAVNLQGVDRAVYVYPEQYKDAKGKVVNHPKAGKEADYDKADDATKEILVHPTVKGAAMIYQRASRLLKVALPTDDRAKKLVDEALSDDGECLCTEPQLYQLATGASREIQAKGSHGGTRTSKVWDSKAVTEEADKLARKAWDGGGILPNAKGQLDLEELTNAFTAALAKLEAELDKAEKAATKAAAKGKGKAAPEETED